MHKKNSDDQNNDYDHSTENTTINILIIITMIIIFIITIEQIIAFIKTNIKNSKRLRYRILIATCSFLELLHFILINLPLFNINGIYIYLYYICTSAKMS